MKRRLTLVPLTRRRDGYILFLFCFVFYFTLYFGRLNLSAAITEITTTGVLEKDAAGLISTAFFVVYGCGQFVNGFISDRLPPFILVTACFLFAGIANLGMYAAALTRAPLTVYLIVWAINGYAQSAVWPTMIRIVSTVLPEEQRVSAGTNMMATTAIGTVLSNLISSGIMKLWGWEECFLLPGVILLGAALIWFFGTLSISRRCVRWEDVPAIQTAQKRRDDRPLSRRIRESELLGLMLRSGTLVMLLSICCFAIIKDGITVWAPTIITETFVTEPSLAVALNTFISLASVFGAGLSKLVMEKWLHDEMKSAAVLFVGAAAGLLLLMTVGMHSLVLMLALLAVIIVCLLGINTMFISLVPLRFGKYGLSSTMTGILNSTAAVSCGVSTYLAGLLAKSAGWGVTIAVWLALALAGLTITVKLIARWMRFKE